MCAARSPSRIRFGARRVVMMPIMATFVRAKPPQEPRESPPAAMMEASDAPTAMALVVDDAREGRLDQLDAVHALLDLNKTPRTPTASDDSSEDEAQRAGSDKVAKVKHARPGRPKSADSPPTIKCVLSASSACTGITLFKTTVDLPPTTRETMPEVAATKSTPSGDQWCELHMTLGAVPSSPSISGFTCGHPQEPLRAAQAWWRYFRSQPPGRAASRPRQFRATPVDPEPGFTGRGDSARQGGRGPS